MCSHCAHGWEVVEWCLAEGGEPVAQALRAAVVLLPPNPQPELPREALGGGWQAYGIHGETLERTQHRLALAALSARVAALTRSQPVAAP